MLEATMSQSSALLSLPTELLAEILSHLSYGDLKLRAPLVCRKFHTLISPDEKTSPQSSTSIDTKLWRDCANVSNTTSYPRQNNASDTENGVTLHPLLSYQNKTKYVILYYSTEKLDKCKVRRGNWKAFEEFVLREWPEDKVEGKLAEVEVEVEDYSNDEALYSDGESGGEDEYEEYEHVPRIKRQELIRIPPPPQPPQHQPLYPLSFFPLAYENACSPPVSRAEYHRIHDERDPAVRISGSGYGGTVSVLDVMAAISKNKWMDDDDSISFDGVEEWEVKGGVLHLYDLPHVDDSWCQFDD